MVSPARKNILVAALCMGLSMIAPAAQAADAVHAADSPTPPVYSLGTGDQLHIIVYGEDKLTGDYVVGSDGTVAMPLIGNIPASGKTVTEVQTAINASLAGGYVLDPHVSVQMLNYRPFFILGEVNHPAQYPYVEQMTVAQAVATAGGYTYRANRHLVFIRHKGQAKEERYEVSAGNAVWVMPGDTLRIGERYF
jgi:polysaccharide export outer membrane protein